MGKLVTDPKLFYVRAMHKPRDYKILGLFGLFIGGLTGRALANTIGPAATLGLGAGLRLLIALSWLTIPKAKNVRKMMHLYNPCQQYLLENREDFGVDKASDRGLHAR